MASSPPDASWLVLVSLTALGGYFTVTLPALPAKLSASEAFVLTSTLLFGPHAGSVTALVESLTMAVTAKSARSTPLRFLFNAVVPATAIRASSEVFFGIVALEPGQIGRENIGALVAPILGLAFMSFACNTLLIAGVLASGREGGNLKLWGRSLPAVSLNYLVGACIATFVVSYVDETNVAVLAIVVPVLLVSYVTFKTSIGRVDDANRHVSQISALYLSTIETLAMAVDAKDQITHGHIRRVQVLATALAHRLGVYDQSQLRAIETAALLHDMGKLAIPEYILNKPGKLTVAEFEKMKRHADIGADLLSSISFPYPVIPIVRHHHENWDGTGYPSRLSAHDIPIGARILSVVDCFDALTSDRPYRPRLTDEDSFRILRERSGWMYDPLIVDTFIQVHPEIAPAALRAGQQAKSLVPTMFSDARPTALEQIRTNAAQSSIIGEFELAIAHANSPNEAIEVTGQFVGMLTPGIVCGLFAVENNRSRLTCVLASGDEEAVLAGLTIPMGERTTGWAVAHETVMANSPASLDLEERAARFRPSLRSALVAPIIYDGEVTGALSVYATSPVAFTDDHQYATERIAAALALHFDLTE